MIDTDVAEETRFHKNALIAYIKINEPAYCSINLSEYSMLQPVMIKTRIEIELSKPGKRVAKE